MQLNWLAYQYREWDGYGRYSSRLVAALQRQGVSVAPWLHEVANMPAWMQQQVGVGWDKLTISCLPPFYLNRVPGRHWLLSMTEGSRLPLGWRETIQRSGVERIIVPCQHNADAFAVTGLPVHIVPGGTDPDEFPVIDGRAQRAPDRPYTFLALADRGARKGWVEVWQAFYKAFGSPTDTPDVRLIIKSRPDGNEMLELIARADRPDPRITILMEDMDMRALYALGDCFAFPSRSEGWGLPPREAATSGLPVIVQPYAGLDDEHTCEWAFVVEGGRLEAIPGHFDHIAGDWMKADVGKLADMMRLCYSRPHMASRWGAEAALWIRGNQTWAHGAEKLIRLIGEHNGFDI